MFRFRSLVTPVRPWTTRFVSQQVAVLPPLLTKYKQQLGHKEPAVWDTYESIRSAENNDLLKRLDREDFLKLRTNLWGIRGNWGIEERIIQVLDDMKSCGHAWTTLEYNEYFIAKLFQAKYNDILTMYNQEFIHGNQKPSNGSFNVILATYILLGKKEEAIQVVKETAAQGDVIPDIRDFDRTMNRCMPKNTTVIQQAKEIITQHGLLSSTKVMNANLLHLFTEKRINDVKWVMEQQDGGKLDITTYNILIKGYADARLTRDVLSVYKDMEKHKVAPNSYICSSMLSIYAHTRDVVSAEKIVRATILGGSTPDESLYNQLIKVYFKARLSQKAFQVFEEVQKNPNLQVNDIILNTMINGLVINKELQIARSLYEQMLKSQFKPDMVTFNTMLKGYMKMGDVESAMKIVSDIFKCQLEPDTVTFTTLIDSLFITKEPTSTTQVLDYIQQMNIKPNIYTYNAIINNWIKQLNMKEAENTIQVMKKQAHLKPTVHTYTNLIQGYVETMDLNKAIETFQLLLHKGITPDRATFNFMIVGFLNHNRLKDAYSCLEQMRKMKLSPTKDTWKLLLDQVLLQKDWTVGKQVIQSIDESGFVIRNDSLRRPYTIVKSHCT